MGNVRLKEQLCWTCSHAAKGDISICPWARDYKPVKGWKASRSIIPTHSLGHGYHSYAIEACPLYDKEIRKNAHATAVRLFQEGKGSREVSSRIGITINVAKYWKKLYDIQRKENVGKV